MGVEISTRGRVGIGPLLIGAALAGALAGSGVFLLAAMGSDDGDGEGHDVRAGRDALALVAAHLGGMGAAEIRERASALRGGYPEWLAVVGPDMGPLPVLPAGTPAEVLPARVDASGSGEAFETPFGRRRVIYEPIPGAPAGVGLAAMAAERPRGALSRETWLGLGCAAAAVVFVLVVVRAGTRRLARDLWTIERGIRGLAETDPGRWYGERDGAAGVPAVKAPVRIVDADDELGRLAWAFARLRERVAADMQRYRDARSAMRRTDRDRLDFLAMVSHELRTPLNTILGYAEVLLDDLDGALTAGQREDLRIIRASGEHLLDLINDILDLSAIRSGQLVLSIESVDLTALARRILDEAEGQLGGKRVHLVTEFAREPIVVRGDARRIWRALQNVVGNALKFTDEGEVRVAVRVDGSDAEVAVSDTGPGIPESAIGTIFDEYRQAGDARARRSGAGLGLAITRSLVELHGGSIRVESELGRGSVFRIRLPMGAERSGSAAEGS